MTPGGEGTVRVPPYGGGRFDLSHITFIVLKKLNLQFLLLYLQCMWEEWVGETVIREWERLAENVRRPSYEGIGFKIA